MGLAHRLGYLWPFSITSESSHASCLRCSSAVAWSKGSQGLANAMSDAQSGPVPVAVGGVTSSGGQASQADPITLAPWQHARVLNQ